MTPMRGAFFRLSCGGGGWMPGRRFVRAAARARVRSGQPTGSTFGWVPVTPEAPRFLSKIACQVSPPSVDFDA